MIIESDLERTEERAELSERYKLHCGARPPNHIMFLIILFKTTSVVTPVSGIFQLPLLNL